MSQASPPARGRELPVGAEPVDDGVSFRVWAPDARAAELLLDDRAVPLEPESDGWWSRHVTGPGPGARYRFRFDGGRAVPDPASRWQPEGPHGPSEVIDPAAFRWTDHDWPGIELKGQILYELHVGTFTPEGTYAAAARELEALRDLGVTTVEIMPVASFPGRFGWGYDGVSLFAPWHGYGTPDDLRRFVDRAHGLGMGVILDVVYNHFGPDGNYLHAYAKRFFTGEATEWGDAIDYTRRPVRDFLCANARHWIREYHFDGLRLDAVHAIVDPSDEHIVAEIVRAARAATPRRILVVAEEESQRAEVVRDWGADAVWNDDLHHSVHAALTGRNEAYLSETRGRPQELISAARWGWLYQGQRYAWQRKDRGTPAFDLPGAAFVNFLDNHDQVANTGRGRRALTQTSPGRYRAMTAYLLLIPGTPMLFQGQEHGATGPFLYFCDHEPALAAKVAEGRADFLSQFPSTRAARDDLPPPHDERTFRRCVLDPSERRADHPMMRLHRDLIALRRTDPTFAAQRADRLHGAVLDQEAFALRWFGRTPADDRLLLVNLGADLHLAVQPEPLLAAPAGSRWRPLLSTEDPAYDGDGTPPVFREDGLHVRGHAAVLMRPERI